MHNRRQFLETLTLLAGLSILLKPLFARAKKLAVPLSRAETLRTVGASQVLELKGTPVLFIRDSETSIRALTPICTHKKCTVTYNRSKDLVECPCHGSTYGLDGKVRKGPATLPLKIYAASLDGERIVLAMD